MLQNLDNAKETFSAILMLDSADVTVEKEVHAFERELRLSFDATCQQ